MRRIGALCVLAAAAAIAVPAAAAPENTRIDAIFAASSCDGSVCEPGTDSALREGDAAAGTLQIHASSESVVGLEWLRIEARVGDGPRWICIQQWEPGPGAFELDVSYRWDSETWPKPAEGWGCPETTPHFHGEPTVNDWYHVRAVARERTSREIEESAEVRIYVANPASAPQWARPPEANGDTVTLRWKPNPEPDVVEYLVRRDGPSGQTTFGVDAAAPREQGCQLVPGAFYSCTDTVEAGAEYRYSLVAYRPGPPGASSCGVSGKACVASPSAPRVAVEASAPPPGSEAGEPPVIPSAEATRSPGVPGPPRSTATAVASGDAVPERGPELAATPRRQARQDDRGSARVVVGGLAVLLLAAVAGAHAGRGLEAHSARSLLRLFRPPFR